MPGETLTYEADGLTMRGELYRGAATAPRAGVLVFPEAFGPSDHARERAERLAGQGYVALACDLHGEARLVDDLDEAIGLIKPLMAEPSRTRARAGKALEALIGSGLADPARIAAIGFCFGGTMALELARAGADVRAVVGFHSGLGTQAPTSDARNIKGKVLVCIGADDPMIDADARRTFEAEMKDGGCDWQVNLYGGTVHGFTNKQAATRGRPEAIRYSAEADARSWAAMTELFGETLG